MISAGAQRGNPMRGKTNILQHKSAPGGRVAAPDRLIWKSDESVL